MPHYCRVLVVAPMSPPSGGMALQAMLLHRLLRKDGVRASFLASNLPLPLWLRACERVPGLRTLIRFVVLWFALLQRVRTVDVVHIFAASWLYFFAVVVPAVIVGRLC